MKTVLTEEGIMMQDGQIISDNVFVELINNRDIKISYTNNNTDRFDYRSIGTDIFPMFDRDDSICSIINNRDNMYIFWNNYTCEFD